MRKRLVYPIVVARSYLPCRELDSCLSEGMPPMQDFTLLSFFFPLKVVTSRFLLTDISAVVANAEPGDSHPKPRTATLPPLVVPNRELHHPHLADP